MDSKILIRMEDLNDFAGETAIVVEGNNTVGYIRDKLLTSLASGQNRITVDGLEYSKCQINDCGNPAIVFLCDWHSAIRDGHPVFKNYFVNVFIDFKNYTGPLPFRLPDGKSWYPDPPHHV